MYQVKRRHLGAVLRAAMVGVMAMSLASSAGAQETRRADRGGARNIPLLVVVSLNRQKVTIYSDRTKILEAPVSSGRSGYDTPAGIYSILQKKRDHYSNLYNDAAMPFMQRLTWSGIALHAGDLPGYPASHGCVRMPFDFAGQLFELTKRGTRVVVMRGDVSPVEFAHPALFKPGPIQPPQEQANAAGNVHLSSAEGGALLQNAAMTAPLTRRSIMAAKEAAAEAAARKADEVRRATAKILREAEAFDDALHEAESAKRRALARIAEADALSATTPSMAKELSDLKTKAQERLAVAQAQIDVIYGQGKEKIDAARAARDEVRAAEAAKVAAEKEANAAAGRPVSVFISRKTRHLYVRQAFQPLFDSPISISNSNASIGTFIYTATDWTNDDAELRWTALSMQAGAGSPRGRPGEAPQTSPAGARAALERVSIPQETLDRINELITPGSSLIISDEGLSKETGEATDFIVVMGGEPQGGIARRRVTPYVPGNDDGLFSSGGGFGFFSWW
jgi:hypothetical protein